MPDKKMTFGEKIKKYRDAIVNGDEATAETLRLEFTKEFTLVSIKEKIASKAGLSEAVLGLAFGKDEAFYISNELRKDGLWAKCEEYNFHPFKWRLTVRW